jgi:hypothetical protein
MSDFRNKVHGMARIVSGKELAECFKKLEEPLGRAVIETIIIDLEVMYGIILVGRVEYRLSDLNDALTKLLGEAASELMMESILKSLDKK